MVRAESLASAAPRCFDNIPSDIFHSHDSLCVLLLLLLFVAVATTCVCSTFSPFPAGTYLADSAPAEERGDRPRRNKAGSAFQYAWISLILDDHDCHPLFGPCRVEDGATADHRYLCGPHQRASRLWSAWVSFAQVELGGFGRPLFAGCIMRLNRSNQSI